MTPPFAVGRYIVCDPIGGGGMATVHLGRMLGAAGFSRVIAIKRMHPATRRDRDVSAMIVDEARLASRIRHSNVVPTLDVVRAGDELLLVMEYVHGAALSQLSRAAAARGEPIPIPIAVRIVLDMLAGLQAAHDARGERGEALDLVHRDISPHNVVVGVDGVARVIDFGIAKAARRLATTQAGQIKGKLGFMAPEQLRREAVDRRTDVYATGLVLWQLLVGRPARTLKTDNLLHAIRQLLAEEIRPPGELADVPPELDAVVMTAVSPAMADRFASADAMAAALEAAAEAAKPTAVARYVELLAGDMLAARAEMLARVEYVSTEEVAADAAVAAAPVPAEPTGDDVVPHAQSDVTDVTSMTATGRDPRDLAPAPAPARGPAPMAGTAMMPAPPMPMPAPWAGPETEPDTEVLVVPAPGRRWTAVAFAVGMLAVVAGALPFLVQRWNARAVVAAPPRPSPAPEAVVVAAPPESTGVEIIAFEDPSAVPSASAPRPSRPAASVKRAPDCNPPYSINDAGIRIPRRECLGP